VHVRTLFFASFRDLFGASETSLELGEGSSVQDLLDSLVRENPALSLIPVTAAVAVNQEYAGPETPLSDGDEVALIPPVAGG